MIVGLSNTLPTLPNEDYHKGYDTGFEDAVQLLEKKVKKLGKSYLKDFLLHLKNMEGERYINTSFTIINHECDCEFCGIKDNS